VRGAAHPCYVVPRKNASGRRPADSAQSDGRWLCRILHVAWWRELLVCLFLAAITISTGHADTTIDRMFNPEK
jgi:hypothetical protein